MIECDIKGIKEKVNMATNLAIDDSLVREAQQLGGHKTKKEAVTEALLEYIQRKSFEKACTCEECGCEKGGEGSN